MVEEKSQPRKPTVKWRDIPKRQEVHESAKLQVSGDVPIDEGDGNNLAASNDGVDVAGQGDHDVDKDGIDESDDKDEVDLPPAAFVRDRFAVGDHVDLKSKVLLDLLSDEEQVDPIEQPALRKSVAASGSVAAPAKLKASDWALWE